MNQRPPQADKKAKPLDPIALPLVLWLDLMASVLGLQRLSEQAAEQAAQELR